MIVSEWMFKEKVFLGFQKVVQQEEWIGLEVWFVYSLDYNIIVKYTILWNILYYCEIYYIVKYISKAFSKNNF